MLLFIGTQMTLEECVPNFNTSHVTVYLFKACSSSCVCCHFNTSHVTVYQVLFLLAYHLLLYFNTSHVTVYLLLVSILRQPWYISIHLMLLFIKATKRIQLSANISIHLMLLFICLLQIKKLLSISFQYISCYCLSSIHVAPLLRVGYFNTSHVTVYHDGTLHEKRGIRFQYISCYCLSKLNPIF